MSLVGRQIAILVDDYFEQPEFEVPLRFLEDNGAEVTVVSASSEDLQAMQRDVNKGDKFRADVLLSDADPDDYEALILPGGAVNADRLRMHEKAREWVNRYSDDGKLIAAICHAPWLLVSADVVEGRRLASYYTLQDDIRNAGGEWVDQPVVLDEGLITSRNPDDLEAFNDAIQAWFRVEAGAKKQLESTVHAVL